MQYYECTGYVNEGGNMNVYVESYDIDRYKVYNGRRKVIAECTTDSVDEIRHLLVVNGTVKKGQRVSLYWIDKLNEAD